MTMFFVRKGLLLLLLVTFINVRAQENNWQAMSESIGGASIESYSGDAVSLSSDGSVLAIGSYRGLDSNGIKTGHVQLFNWSGTTWVQMGDNIDGGALNDNFGLTVSLNDDGTVVAIGGKNSNGINGYRTGQVRIFKWNGTNWIQKGSTLEGDAAFESFGSAVSLDTSGDTIAVGASGNDGNIRIFNWNGTTWDQQGSAISNPEDIDYFGEVLSLSGNGLRVIVGAPSALKTVDWIDDENDMFENIYYNYRGLAQIYDYNAATSTWTQLGINIEGEGEDDKYGSAVDISDNGNIIAIGSENHEYYSGHVRLFKWNGTAWGQMGEDINGEATSDNSGNAISLSADGERVAIAARRNDNKESGSGNVRVFDWQGASWSQVGRSMNGDAPNDSNGTAIRLSSDGNRVAMSAPSSSEHGYKTGNVRVYQLLQSNNPPVIVAPTITTINYPESIQEVVTKIDAHNNDGGEIDAGLTYSLVETGDFAQFSINSSTGELNFSAIPDYESPVDENGDNVYNITVLVDDTGSFNNTITVSLIINVINGQEYITQQTGISINGEEGDKFGTSVSFNGDGTVVAISAPMNSKTPYIYTSSGGAQYTNYYYRGHVRMFKKNSTTNTWEQLGDPIAGLDVNEKLGSTISISSDGTIVAIGSPYFTTVNGNLSGEVRIYKWNGTQWSQMGDYLIGDEHERFGTSVSMSSDGSSIVIGAENYSGPEDNSIGRVKVYTWNGSDWGQVGNSIIGENASDYSGNSVDINADGTIVAIGAKSNDSPNGSYSGHVRVYKYSGGQWSQQGDDLDGDVGNDNLGWSVSINGDGTIVACGAPKSENRIGQVKIFEWSGTSWNQMGSNINGEGTNDYSGESISINEAGSRVIIGANNNKNQNGSYSGHVRIYEWNNAWVRIGSDIDGEAAYDYFGTSVSMSGDGNWLVAGAPENDTNGSNAGNVRIFELVPQNAPVFTAPTNKNLEVYENNTTGVLVNVVANDGDATDTAITYSLETGGDNDFFTINATSGVINFAQALNYATPVDDNTDNTYELGVIADDGMPGNNITSITIFVKVLEIDEVSPANYTVAIDQSEINETNIKAMSFTYAGAEINTTYNFSLSSSNGTDTVSGTGTIDSATGVVENIDVSSLNNGTLTLTFTLTDNAENKGENALDTVTKNSDSDSDLDGIADTIDNCINVANVDQLDTDNDEMGDVCDTDDDNDGTLDVDDAFPLDDAEDTDTDEDGTGDNADTDDDGDGTDDVDDAFPLDDTEDTDTDEDGTGDNADTDDDGDGTNDVDDAFPLDDTEDTDTDEDGTGDNADTDDDGDGTKDVDDVFPLDGAEDTDTDNDGTGDNADTDDDGDGTNDVDDAFPLDGAEDTDTDNDGTGNNADTDDDNDGFLDTEDLRPLIVDVKATAIAEEVPDSLKPAQAFTPNGDGNNDTWVIPGIENYPNNIIKIYNRYGHEVYTSINYRNDWGGNMQGKSGLLPAGSYFALVDLGNGQQIRTWVFLNY